MGVQGWSVWTTFLGTLGIGSLIGTGISLWFTARRDGWLGLRICF
jgi:hypothetical protein